jgi:HEAT repeat protein
VSVMSPASWITPRQSVAAECQRRGKPAVVAGCIDLLQGNPDVDDSLVLALGGPLAEQVLDGREGGKLGYWLRVWAARGLLHQWDDRATAAIIQATGDEAWRVREMAAKVIARHRVGDAFDAVTELRNDQVPRVRAAAERAVMILTSSGN